MPMKRSLWFAVLTLLFAALPLSAAGRPTLPPGMGEYVMVLWPPGSPMPRDGTKTINVPEPDIPKLGGKVLGSDANVRLIQLPLQAAAGLRRHQAVVFLQRVWMGESLEGWNEAYTPSPSSASSNARLKAGANADTNLTWGPKAYTYDASGNIKSIGGDNYTYDSAGRLIQSTVNGKTESYSYDSFGNLIQKGVTGANPVNIPVDGASNRLLGVPYDAAGNATTGDDGHRTYKYDSLNMLTRVKPSGGQERRMLYDANDERIGMLVVNDSLGRWTIRDFEGRIVREYKTANLSMWTWEGDYFYGEGSLVGGETQQWGDPAGFQYGGRRHYHLDHLGSVRMVTDESQTSDHPARSLSEHEYYPFGATMTRTYQEQFNGADPHLDAMRFAGHWRDFLGALNVDNTDYIDYMHARYYDPNLGRFLSVDPELTIDYVLRKPQGWNRYAYVRNTPLIGIDPDGKAAVIFIVDAGRDDAKEMVGHAAMYVTSQGKGIGVSAYGDDWFQHGEMGFIHHYTAEGRGVHTYVLDTTPEQDAAMYQFIKDHPSATSGRHNDRYNGGIDESQSIVRQNCTTACVNVLKVGGLVKNGTEPGKLLGLVDRPKTLQNALESGSLSGVVRARRFFKPRPRPAGPCVETRGTECR
jgi:RHS repeat-associated protein